MNKTAIILAGGKGRRMGSAVSKQYLLLNGYPVIYYTIKAFEESETDNIVLVAAAGEEEYCRENIIKKYGFRKVRTVATGGSERYSSVYEGLKAIERLNIETDIVLIHDGARPFVTPQTIEASINCAGECGACVAAVRSKDTVRLSDDSGNIISTPDRNSVWQIQTPQTFRYSLIKAAYDSVLSSDVTGITDDAMVLERYGGYTIKLVEASYDNIKITTPEDLTLGKAILDGFANV